MLGYLGNMSALADYSVGIGDRVDIEENNVVGIGRDVDIDNQFAIAIGSTTVAQNDGAIVIGYQASSTDVAATLPTNNIAIGVNANVQGLNSVAIGNAAAAINDNTMVLGGSTNPLSVGIGTDIPNTNASLDLADVDKGFLLNRVTTAERTTMETTPASGVALTTTDIGLMVYDIDVKGLFTWDGTAWVEIGGTPQYPVSSTIPDLINYKAIIKDGNGVILSSSPISLQFTIYEGAALVNNVYQESHSTNTNENGLVIINIGEGNTSDDFSIINWSKDAHYLNVQIDTGSGLVDLGTSPFTSVPYALRAKYAENLIGDSGKSQDSTTRIEALEAEVQELKEMISKLIKVKAK
jgi:hypothetical protein